MGTDTVAVYREPAIPARSLGAAIICCGGVLLSALVAIVPYAFTFGLAGALLATAVVYVSLRRKTGPFDVFESFNVYSLVYFLYFGAGAIFVKFNPETLPGQCLAPYITPALLLGLVGYVAFTAGYATCFRRTTPAVVADFAPRGLLPFFIPGVIGFAGHVAGSVLNRLLARGMGIPVFTSALSQLSPIYLFAWFLVWHSFWAGHNGRLQNFVLFACFFPMTAGVIYATVGQKALTIILLLVPALAYWYARHRLPLKTIAAVILVGVFVVFPVYNTYRSQNRSLPVARKMDQTVRTAMAWDRSTFFEQSVLASMSRFALITSPAAVLRETGRWVDFEYGKTLIIAPLATVIPKAIWPDRPNLLLGHDFGRTFHLLPYTDRETQIAATAVGELYWNFHVPGVIIGMFLLGAVYRWIYKKYGEGGTRDSLRKSAYLMFLVLALLGEGSLAGWASGFVRLLLIVSGLMMFYRLAGFVRPIDDAAVVSGSGTP
ncbi:MAG: hypothetical protein LAO51_11015 [Acidobacteriia bacterium]|nr:hypothetical protein [Terriglobia bacterium]